MRILEVTTWNFRNLPSGETFHLGEHPRIVVVGPNEAGKTSLFEAISLAFTLDETSENTSILDPVTRYGSNSRPRIQLKFKADGRNYILYKNWENRKGELKVDGVSITHPRRIKEKLSELFGVFTLETFRFLLLVGQDELIPDERAQEKKLLQRVLENYIEGGRGSIDTNRILFELKKIIGERGDYIKESGQVYRELIRKKESIEDKIRELEEKLSLFFQAFGERKKKEADFQKIEGQLNEFDTLISYLELYIPYREAKERLDFFNEKGPLLEKLIEEKKRILSRLKKVEEELKNYPDIKALEKQKKSLEKEVKNLTSRLENALSLEKEISSLKEKLKGKNVPSRKDVQLLYKVHNSLDQINSYLSEKGVSLKVDSQRNIVIVSDGEKTFLEEGKTWERAIGSEEFKFSIDGVAALTIRVPFLRKISKEIEKDQKELAKFKEKFGASEPDVLEKRLQNFEKLRSLEAQSNAILSGSSIDQLKEELQKFRKELKEIEEKISRIPLEMRGELEGEKRTLEELKNDKEREIEEIKEDLAKKCQSFDTKELRERLPKERNETEDPLRRFEVELLPEEKERVLVFSSWKVEDLKRHLNKIKKEKAILLKENSRLNREIGQLQGILKEVPSEDMLRELKNEQEKLNETIKFIELHKRALRILIEAIPEARDDAIKFIQDEIVGRFSKHFEELSLGKYRGVNFDFSNQESWGISVVDTKGIEYPLGDRYDLSQGAKAQLFLALRLAFIDALSQDRNLPLFLDDTLSDFDPGRAKRALELLRKVSENRQVILLTCHPEFSSFGYTVKIGEFSE